MKSRVRAGVKACTNYITRSMERGVENKMEKGSKTTSF